MQLSTSKTHTIDQARIITWDIDKSTTELEEMWKRVGGDTDALSRFTSDKRKREYLGVRLALSELLNITPHIGYQADGKPFLQNSKLHLSVSHSKNLIAVITHPTLQVGIDIEHNTEKIKKIYHRFLSPQEQQELSNGQNVAQLLIAWSAKEALYKIIGKTAVDFAKQLYLFPFEVAESGSLKAIHIPTNKMYHLTYIQTANYTLVYCVES